MKKVLILDNEDIAQKTRRIAYQIVEDNYDEDELIFIGIKPNGLTYAHQLKKEVQAIDDIKIKLFEMELDKAHPLDSEIQLKLGKESLNNKTVIIIDDVANTGKTALLRLKTDDGIFTQKSAGCRFSVDRQRIKLYPVSADFVGLSLSTNPAGTNFWLNLMIKAKAISLPYLSSEPAIWSSLGIKSFILSEIVLKLICALL